MRTIASSCLLFAALALGSPRLTAQPPNPQQRPASQADSTKSRKAFIKHQKAVQKKMDKQRKASLKKWNKAHPATHEPATNHKPKETHKS